MNASGYPWSLFTYEEARRLFYNESDFDLWEEQVAGLLGDDPELYRGQGVAGRTR